MILQVSYFVYKRHDTTTYSGKEHNKSFVHQQLSHSNNIIV